MDAKFLYVPKSWIRGLLRIRIAKVMVSLIFRGKQRYVLQETDMLRKINLQNDLIKAQSDTTDFIQNLR